VTASLLVSPKAVYALPLVWLVLFGLARLGRSLLPSEPVKKPWALALVWAGLAVVPWGLPTMPSRPLPVAETIAPLQTQWSRQAVNPRTRWRMLELDGGWCSYLDLDRCAPIWLWKKDPSLGFSDFLRQEGVDAVVVGPAFLRSLRVRNDAEFARFRQEPASFGFREIRLTHDHTLYLWDRRPPLQ